VCLNAKRAAIISLGMFPVHALMSVCLALLYNDSILWCAVPYKHRPLGLTCKNSPTGRTCKYRLKRSYVVRTTKNQI
jgi:hypothetical protein